MKLTRIDYNGGYLWVDKEAAIGKLCYFPFKNEIYTPTVETGVHPDSLLIIAQSPNLLIPNVPYVEFEEDKRCVWVKASDRFPVDSNPESLEDVIFRRIKDKSPITNTWAFHPAYLELETNGRVCGDLIRYNEIEWLDEAAQSKGRYSEDDLLHAINRTYNYVDGDGWSREYIREQILKELNQPPLEIEIETKQVCGDMSCLRMSLNGEDSTCCGDSIITIPVTYERDGKTYLKVKQ